MQTHVLSGRRRIGALALVLVGALLFGAGCGKPAYTYVANQDSKTYVKVPSTWTKVDATPADLVWASRLMQTDNADSDATQLFMSVRWSAMYDASSDPLGEDMFTAYPTAEPVVYVLVTPLTRTVQKQLSFDDLRNLNGPVTDDRRAYYESQGVPMLPDFELIDDETLSPASGLHGVRVVYNETLPSGILHTFDMTALTNDRSSMLYLLLIRCTADCYRAESVQLNDIVTSFTVRSKA
jgi:hypothetical protein